MTPYALSEWERVTFDPLQLADDEPARRCGLCGTVTGLSAAHDCEPSRPRRLRWLVAGLATVIVVALRGRKGKP